MNNGIFGNQNPMNQMGINMIGNFNNNMNNHNLMNNMNNIYPVQNQINPLMYFNNMNNGMNQNNSQIPNQMNFNYLNLYQRIIELENIIREKDKEIEKLKKQIENEISNDMVDFLQKHNESIPSNKDASLEINFKFIPSENTDNEIIIKETCNLNEQFIEVKKRISKKLDKKVNKLQFTFKNMLIFDKLKIIQMDLCNNDTVMVIEKKNVVITQNEEEEEEGNEEGDRKINLIFTTTQGISLNIITSKKYPIGQVLTFYLFRMRKLKVITDLMNGKEGICFLFNSIRLTVRDKKTVGHIFEGISNPKIIVNDVDNMIGG
jgi:hypothetical protein